MALVTHQMQGSCATFPSRPLSWNKGLDLKRFVTSLQMAMKRDGDFSLRCTSCFSVGAPLICGPKAKSLRISAFKGSPQNDESGGRADGSKPAKKSVKISYVQGGSEETSAKSSNIQDVPLSFASEADETVAGSLAIQNLFKKWLTLLHTQPPNQVVDETLEGTEPGKMSLLQNGAQKIERAEILKGIWCYFWGLDAAVKIPLMTLICSIPCFLAVTVAYGAEVSKDLTPLFIATPLVAALYVKIFQGIRALYVFSFKQTINVVMTLRTFFLLAYNYFASGKIKEDTYDRLWQLVVEIRAFDYIKLLERKRKELEEWAEAKKIDYIESIWPYYCRTLRMLKKSDFI